MVVHVGYHSASRGSILRRRERVEELLGVIVQVRSTHSPSNQVYRFLIYVSPTGPQGTC